MVPRNTRNRIVIKYEFNFCRPVIIIWKCSAKANQSDFCWQYDLIIDINSFSMCMVLIDRSVQNVLHPQIVTPPFPKGDKTGHWGSFTSRLTWPMHCTAMPESSILDLTWQCQVDTLLLVAVTISALPQLRADKNNLHHVWHISQHVWQACALTKFGITRTSWGCGDTL